MKYIITEEQLTTTIKKFNKEKAHRGRFSDVIEELVLSHFKRPVCDVAAIFIPDLDNYIVLILTPDGYSNGFSDSIAHNIKNFIGINPNVIISQSRDCNKTDE